MSLRQFKLGNLGKKLELKNALKKELDKVDEVIDEMTNPKKVKIIKKKK